MDSISKLGELLTNAPKSIEIIPGNGQEWLESFPDNVHAPFLFVEGNLGVPEKVLYKTYMTAVNILGDPKTYLKRLQSDEGRQDALVLTGIILLANPAHQTALNIRKVLVLGEGLASEEDDNIVHICTAELQFTAALLSVKQCSKVSILWHHRRALLSRIHHSRPLGNSNMDRTKYGYMHNSCSTDDYFVTDVSLPSSALQTEFDLASRTCEVYPRNYHAWYHRSLCLQSCLATYHKRTESRSTRSFIHSVDIPGYASFKAPVHVQTSEASDAEPSFATEDLEKVLKNELENIRTWLERHVSDYSAVDYVCRVAEAMDGLPNRESSLDHDLNPYSNPTFDVNPDHPQHTFACVQHALGLVQSYPSHESLWVYLRQTLHILLHASRSCSFSSSAHPNSNPSPSIPHILHDSESTVKRILTQASQKCLSLRSSDLDPSTSTPLEAINTETHTIIRHALRFFLWMRQNQIGQAHDKYDGKKSNTTVTDDLLASACPHFKSACSSAKEKSTMDLLRIISSVE